MSSSGVESWKGAATIHEDIDEMGLIVVNTTLNLCYEGLQKVMKVEHLEITLVGDEIAW